MNVDVLFIGGIWPENEESAIIENSKGNVQIAANMLQMSIIKGIEENLSEPLTIINEKFIGAFPQRYKKMIIRKYNFSHVQNQTHKDYNIGFINLPIVKHFCRYWNSRNSIRQACNSSKGDCIFVIGYSMTYSIVKGLLYAKKYNKKVKTCLIVPDLPEYMNLGNSRGKMFEVLKNYSNKKLAQLIKRLDSFAVLTKYIYEKLDSSQPYVVVEGIASDSGKTIGETTSAPRGIKNLVYTGTLEAKYGVCDLIDAFHAIKDNDLRLVVCGAGDGESYIREIAEKDPRIQFKGIVTNREAREIQKTAYLLVNPRNSNEEYTKYSFPSKTMEYMMSGKPVLMYKLLGIPEEYDSYLFYVEDNLEKSLRNILQLSEEELSERGEAARRFVITEKNAVAQTSKILEMLNHI